MGCEFPAQSDKVWEKYKKTCLKKYGTEYARNSLEVKLKIKEKCLKKYGVEHHWKNKEILEKRNKTNLERYNCLYPINSDEIKTKILKKHKGEFYNHFKETLLLKKIKLLSALSEYINNDIFEFECLKCGKKFKSSGTNSKLVICPECKLIFNSKSQIEIYNWLEQANIKVIKNDRTQINPLELDIYLPDYNIAIEFDGIYWHSELFKDKNYHLNKTNLCKEKNIQLIHIFENEWDNKQNVVKSIILAKLGIFNQRIMARKCQMRELSNIEYKEFVETNHIQGFIPAKYKIGLFYNGELVQICSFGKSRFKKDEIELLRHCSKLNTQVVGGLSRLLSYYKFDNLITYVDLRYGNGNGYKNWELIEQTKPNYWYVKNNILESRMKYQKYKLNKLLENFDSSLSEVENMYNNGFTRIWDCGNLKLRYIK